jgi:hypothetical protein
VASEFPKQKLHSTAIDCTKCIGIKAWQRTAGNCNSPASPHTCQWKPAIASLAPSPSAQPTPSSPSAACLHCLTPPDHNPKPHRVGGPLTPAARAGTPRFPAYFKSPISKLKLGCLTHTWAGESAHCRDWKFSISKTCPPILVSKVLT